MPPPPRLSLFERIEHGAQAVRQLSRDADGVPGLEGLFLRQVLKYHPERVVFQARLGGRTVILKRLTLPGADQMTPRIMAEYRRIAPAFADDPRLGLSACLGHWPQLGLLAFERLHGKSLSDRLVGMRPRHRRHLIVQSGDWLARYAAPSRHVADFRADWQIQRCETRDLVALRPADRDLLARLLDWLRARAASLQGRPLTRALCHGDLIPANLMIHRGRLSGFDYGPGVDLPVAQEMMRFLLWARLSRGPGAAQDALGAARGDFDALLSGCGHLLLPDEGQDVFPFFCGFILFQRIADIPEREHQLIGLRRAAVSIISKY